MSDKPEILHIVGKIVETDRPRRLVITWSAPADQGNPAKTSRVTFEIEPAPNAGFHELVAASTKVTVTHDELDSDPEMLKSISNGWPIVLSGLKTLLETGKPFLKKVSRSNDGAPVRVSRSRFNDSGSLPPPKSICISCGSSLPSRNGTSST